MGKKIIISSIFLICSFSDSVATQEIEQTSIYKYENYADVYCDEKKTVVKIIKCFQNPENKTYSPKLAKVVYLLNGGKYHIKNIEIRSSSDGVHIQIGSYKDFVVYAEPDNSMAQAKAYFYYVTPQLTFLKKVESNLYPYWELHHPSKEEREYVSNIFKNKIRYLENKFSLNNNIVHNVMLRSITIGMRRHVLCEYNKADYKEDLGLRGLTIDYIRNLSNDKIPANERFKLSEILAYWDINAQSDALWEKVWICVQEEFDGDDDYLYKLWVLWALNSDYITPEQFSRVVEYNPEVVRKMLKENDWDQHYTDLYTKLSYLY